MCINLYTLPKRSIAMLSWNVLTTSRQLLVTQLRFRYMFLSASWEHLDSFVRLLLTIILDELFLVLNMFHEFSKVHGPSDRSRIVKKCQVVSRIGYRSRQEVSRHTIRHTSCSNSYSGTGPSECGVNGRVAAWFTCSYRRWHCLKTNALILLFKLYLIVLQIWLSLVRDSLGNFAKEDIIFVFI